MVRLPRQDDDSWAVSRFTSEHNHPLSSTYGERRQWKSHSRIDQMTRDQVRHLHNNTCRYLESALLSDHFTDLVHMFLLVGNPLGRCVVGLPKNRLKAICYKLLRSSGLCESRTLVLSSMCTLTTKRELGCSSGVWVVQIFECLEMQLHLIQPTARTCTTFRSACSLGVNNHFQTVVFDAVLLTQETT